MAETDKNKFVVAGWFVDPASMRISKGNKTIKLEPRAMALLAYLAHRPGVVVSRRELEDELWTGTVVGYDAVSNAVIKLRRAFGDKARKPRVIETIAKSGYRLVAEVSCPSEKEPSALTGADHGLMASPESRSVSDPETAPSGRRWPVASLVAVMLVVLASGALWWQSRVAEVEPVKLERMAFPLPSGPSIAVLPFTNLSDDRQQEYFADGMTDDLITDLSKVSGLFVIARNSVFTYKEKAIEIRQVAEELGVRYVLEGSIRRADNQVRINAQLIDAISGGHVWAERYDGSLDDIFSMQDRITESIVTALALKLTDYGQDNPEGDETVYPEAYDAFLRGWQRYRQGSPEDLTKALSHFQQAIELDPGYSRAYSALAAVYWNITRNGWWNNLFISPSQALEQTRLTLRKARERPSALAHQIESERAAYLHRKADKALAEARRAIILDNNDPAGHLALATALLKAGKPPEAVESVRRAMRLDPHYPSAYLVRLGQAQLAMGQFENAATALESAARHNPDDDWTYVYLTATYGHLGRDQEAKNAREKANSLRAQAGWGALTILTTHERYFRWIGDPKPLRDGLRKAGVEVGGNWRALVTGKPGQEVSGATTIDVETARAMHERGAIFIDISFIWFQKRIPGTYYLSVWTNEFNEIRLAELVGKNQELVIYHGGGASPRRTFQALAKAVTWGFNRVHYFPQGLDQWQAAGYPLETRS